MDERVVIRSDNFACDDHCSVRLMKTNEHSRRSHLPSPSGRSSRTSSSHRPISGPSLLVFLPLCRSRPQITGFSLLLFHRLCRSRPQIIGFSLFLSREWLIEFVLVSCLLVRVVRLLLQGH